MKSLAVDHVVQDYADNVVGGAWAEMLLDYHVKYLHGFIDEYTNEWRTRVAELSYLIKNASYSGLFGMIQFFLQHPRCPKSLGRQVAFVLQETRAAYRVVDGGLIVPIASEAEASAIELALTDLGTSKLDGARKHLRAAINLCTEGSWADSVRESIQAVEAVARMLEPSANTLGPALDRLAKAGHIHRALKAGLSKVYGYTSDEPGIRHPLLEDGDAKVDETDAIFMMGACASFVSYLIGKARTTGLLGK